MTVFPILPSQALRSRKSTASNSSAQFPADNKRQLHKRYRVSAAPVATRLNPLGKRTHWDVRQTNSARLIVTRDNQLATSNFSNSVFFCRFFFRNWYFLVALSKKKPILHGFLGAAKCAFSIKSVT